MSTAPEPAIKSYFFGKGYTDLRSTIEESWRRNLDSARDHFGKAERLFPGETGNKAMAVLWGAAGISVVVFGTIVFLVASVVHVTVLAAFFLLIYLCFTLVYLAERGYLGWRQFFTVCPDCHQKNRLPEYFCSNCGEVHRRLIPSSYGILHHTCTCGQKLPATFFLKRGELKSRCPACEHLLEAGHTESRKAFVPVFGGPSVGKSAFLFSAVHQVVDRSASLGFQPSFLDSRTESDFARLREQFAQGRTPDKTLAALPRAFNLQLQRQGQSPRVLYLYDPAGEAFNETEGLVLHRYQEYLSGLIFLIDPFAFPAVQERYEESLPGVRDALKPSALPVEDAFSRILISMEEHFGLEQTGRIKQPVAVVINKTDAFDLEQVICEAAVQERIKASPEPVTAESMRGQIVREQLLRWDQAHLVQQLEARCARVRYFTCSSLGRMPDGTTQPFEACGVLEPLLWILSRADSAFAPHGKNAA